MSSPLLMTECMDCGRRTQPYKAFDETGPRCFSCNQVYNWEDYHPGEVYEVFLARKREEARAERIPLREWIRKRGRRRR